METALYFVFIDTLNQILMDLEVEPTKTIKK